MAAPVASNNIDSSELKKISLRLAVYEVFENVKKLAARLEISPLSNGSCNVKVSGNLNESVQRIRDLILENKSEPDDEMSENFTPEDVLSKGSLRLKSIITESGYLIEDLPASNNEFKFLLDMRTGEMLGSSESLHDAVPPGTEDIGRKIYESLVGMFKDVHAELIAAVSDSVAAGSHEDAIRLVCEAYDSGRAGFAPTSALLECLHSFEIDKATEDNRRKVLSWRAAAAEIMGRFDVAARAASEILIGWEHDLNAEEICALRMVQASAAIKRGSKESALSIWKELLDDPISLGANNRGWAWRNISITLQEDDPEALKCARYSADAFLEAGEKTQAARSLMLAAKCLMHCEASRALSAIDEILFILDGDSLEYREAKAATLHARANRLLKLGRGDEALIDAQGAVDLRRGIMGVEEELVSSLYLAAFAANCSGNNGVGDSITLEADKLAAELGTSRYALGKRIAALGDSFNKSDAQQLIADARAEGDEEVAASVRFMQAEYDSTLSDSSRLMLLEEGLSDLLAVHSNSDLAWIFQCAIGNQLFKMSQFKRALSWYEKAMKADPYDSHARDRLLKCLWALGAWGEAVIFLKSQLAIHGDKPGLMFAYGKSLYEAGDMSNAFRALRKAEELAAPESNLVIDARLLAEKAFALAGTLVPVIKVEDSAQPVTLEELTSAINNFSDFISNAKRMVFWSKIDNADYSWIEKPERQAQHLLHTFLKARFLERIDVYEEINTGAGRLDIYVQLKGGLASVIELKMCGFGYSSTYASAGEYQVSHYMGNRRSSIGYVVVFDARLRDFASPFSDELSNDALTITTVFVDLRPRVVQKRGKEE